MKNYISILFLLFVVPLNSSNSLFDKLLVVSYDGFRYDYLDIHKDITPYLNSIKSSSSYAKCLLNVFPTQTFTNHFSIATGLYPEVHGVLGSKVFDAKSNKLLKYSYELFHYNEDILPIWSLNEKAGSGRHSGVMMWPGSDYEYSKINPTFKFNYNKTVPFEKRVSTVINWFKDTKTPANFVMLYFEQPDEDSHPFGPDSKQNCEQIKRVDGITKYIIESLQNNNLSDVNVLFLSDHGMEGVKKDQIINLDEVIGKIADMYGTSPVLQIYPKSGNNAANVFNKLKEYAEKKPNFEVFLQANIPERLHIKNCGRTPPILAVAKPPYAFQDLFDGIKWYIEHRNATENGTFGVHGYDPEYINMHPYFIAHGPLFKKNFYAGELKTIDLYSLFSHILNIRELPPVRPNGTLSGIEKIFVSSSDPNIVKPHGLYLLISAILTFFSIGQVFNS